MLTSLHLFKKKKCLSNNFFFPTCKNGKTGVSHGCDRYIFTSCSLMHYSWLTQWQSRKEITVSILNAHRRTCATWLAVRWKTSKAINTSRYIYPSATSVSKPFKSGESNSTIKIKYGPCWWVLFNCNQPWGTLWVKWTCHSQCVSLVSVAPGWGILTGLFHKREKSFMSAQKEPENCSFKVHALK